MPLMSASPSLPSSVGILGGMGPAAGADFVRLFVDACTEQLQSSGTPVRDQAYPEHWLAQVPVPDRVTALQDRREGAHQPGDAMLQAIGKLAAVGVQSVAIACNTAHAWHGLLQSRFPQMDVLHAVREVAISVQARGIQRVGLLATRGTYDVGLYQQELDAVNVACLCPTDEEREQLMRGIFDGVKAGDYGLARRLFAEVALALSHRHGIQTIVMGCTEIPLALAGEASVAQLDLVNPSAVLAKALARCAYEGVGATEASSAPVSSAGNEKTPLPSQTPNPTPSQLP